MILKRKNAVLVAAGMMLIATAFTQAMNHISAPTSSARVNGANAVTQVEVTLSSLKAGDDSQYTIKFETSPTGAIPAEGGQINIQFPEGTSFSASMAATSITVTANGNTKSLTVPPVIKSRTVSLTTPVPIGNNEIITVIFALTAGLNNPAIWQSYGSVASNRPLIVTTSTDVVAASASTAYKIIPDPAAPGILGLSSATVVANQTIVINGSNFTPAAADFGPGPKGVHQITGAGTTIATLNGKKLESTHITYPINLDSTGWFHATLTLPDESATLTPGTLELKFTDTGGQTGTVALTIPVWSISVSPAISIRGSDVAVTGSGFPIGYGVQITYGGTNFTSLASLPPDSSGKISATMRVPGDTAIPSANTLEATVTGLVGNAITSHDVPAASISLSPTSGPPGSIVTVTGSYFPRGSVQTLSIAELSVLRLPVPYTDVNGSFVAEILIPGVDEGALNVAASLNNTSAGAIFTLTAPVTAPAPLPTPITASSVGLAPLTSQENLVRVWSFNNATKGWSFFDPHPAFAAANSLTELVLDQVYWIKVQADQIATLNGKTQSLFSGWNLLAW